MFSEVPENISVQLLTVCQLYHLIRVIKYYCEEIIVLPNNLFRFSYFRIYICTIFANIFINSESPYKITNFATHIDQVYVKFQLDGTEDLEILNTLK